MDKPYFLWDYDLTDDQVREILHGANEVEKRWLMGRILTSAHFNDVWKYLTVREIVDQFPKLRLRSDIKRSWKRAFTVWGYHV